MTILRNNLEKSIFATLAYFDVFDYPLTLFEIWKWLYKFENWKLEIENLEPSGSLADIQKILESSDVLKSLVSSQRGFYFLKGKDNLVELRQKRYNLAEKKFKKALRIARFFKFIPGIKMIAVCNSLAWSNAREGGDIDFFIITAKNKIWTTRFLAAGLLKLFGLRPTKNNTQDKICLSFFVDEENLNLESIALEQPDAYLIYWITQLAPIYDRGGIYEKFLKANEWIKKYLPNSFGSEISERRKVASRSFSSGVIASPDEIGTKQSRSPTKPRDCHGAKAPRNDLAEKFFRWLQMKVMPSHLKEMANHDTRVIINDGMLKFHENDRREEYKEKWIKRVNGLTKF
jgi:tetratricopeptide (TPR) repeat protein